MTTGVPAILVSITSYVSRPALQYEGFLRREEANAAVRALADKGVPMKQPSCSPAAAGRWSAGRQS